MYVCILYVCMYACMYVCMYVCMYGFSLIGFVWIETYRVYGFKRV